jgi:hypothetical protein
VMVVSGRMSFDAFGRVVGEAYPVTEPLGTPGKFNPTQDGVAPTRTEYDVLDRPTKVTFPDNTSMTTAYGFGYDRPTASVPNGLLQFEVAVTDANGVRHESG